VVEVVHDSHAVEVQVSLTGTTVSDVTTVEIFFPTGQFVMVDVDDD
jgi:hypothetical protein